MNGWGKRRQRLGTTFVEMFMVLHPSCFWLWCIKKPKVIAELRRMFISGAVWSVFLHLVLSSPPEGAVPGTDRRWRGGCLLDCGGWGLNRAVLCVPAEVGSVCQDQNTRASVCLTARLTYPSCTCLPSNAAQTVCEWGSFFIVARPPALFPPNKHCTGNCRDIWDFWEVPVERRWELEQGCSLWHLGGEGRAKTQKKEGGSRGEGVTLPWVVDGVGSISKMHIYTDKQVQVTQFLLTPLGAPGPGVRAKADLPLHRRGWPRLKVRKKWYSVTQGRPVPRVSWQISTSWDRCTWSTSSRGCLYPLPSSAARVVNTTAIDEAGVS